jgi:hypothetical protein
MHGETVVISVAGLYVQPALCGVSVRTIFLAHDARPDCWLAASRHIVYSCSRRGVVAAKLLLCCTSELQALDVSETDRKRLVVHVRACVRLCRYFATEGSNLATVMQELLNKKTVKFENSRWHGYTALRLYEYCCGTVCKWQA